MSEVLQSLWNTLCQAEFKYLQARLAYLQHRGDSLVEVRAALEDPAARGTAIRLLPSLPLEARRDLFSKLMDLASFAHGDIVAVRDLIADLGQPWLSEHLPAEIDRITLAPSVTYEEYRRLAELLRKIDPEMLGQLVARAKGSADPDIKEVADDFET